MFLAACATELESNNDVETAVCTQATDCGPDESCNAGECEEAFSTAELPSNLPTEPAAQVTEPSGTPAITNTQLLDRLLDAPTVHTSH